jgi:hypothetical protein
MRILLGDKFTYRGQKLAWRMIGIFIKRKYFIGISWICIGDE